MIQPKSWCVAPRAGKAITSSRRVMPTEARLAFVAFLDIATV
jgi:hypothetical protein